MEKAKRLKKIEELKRVHTDAYEYYDEDEPDSLFEKIFLDDNLVDKIKNENRHFIIGDKGSGKTAYAVHISNKADNGYSARIKRVADTIYEKFVTMKKDGMLNMSTYKDIWTNILLMILSKEINSLLSERKFKYFFKNGKFRKEFKLLEKEFFSTAFKPEILRAFEFVSEITKEKNIGISGKFINARGTNSAGSKNSTIDTNYELSLMNLQKRFEDLLIKYRPEKMMILFIDGLDARPNNIDTDDYRYCIKGLAESVVELNNGILKSIDVKIRLLIRPDIMYSLSIHNANQLITNNSLVLNWCTSYQKYRKSNIFKVADLFFSKQQNESFTTGECWDLYFPYKIRRRDYFIALLDRSFYKPRDIITICNILISKCKGSNFSKQDIYMIDDEYSNYVKGELKDYMLAYLNYDEYEIFEQFIKSFDYKQFSYETYINKYNDFIAKNRSDVIPKLMENKNMLLQTMYDVSLICMVVYKKDGTSDMKWAYKEKGYTSIRPPVSFEGNFQFHSAYARAFKIKEDPSKIRFQK